MTSLLIDNPAPTASATNNVAPVKCRRRVLHLINGDDYSGAERVQDLLSLRLRDFGYEVGIACTKPGRFREARQARDVPLYDLPMCSRFDVRPLFSLAKLIRREGYELLHTHSARTALIGRPATMLAGVPLVHHVHCQTSTDVLRHWLSRLNAKIERISLLGAAGVVAVSPTIQNDLLRRGVPGRLLALIPNGVPSPGPLAALRRRWEDWVVGTVAMFRPRKGIEILLEAVARLRERGFPVRLRAVGCFQTADYEAEIRTRADRLGLRDVVDWTGFTNDVNAELAKMDLFVLPSLVPEGMPMSVLEAMAAGVPVIGTNVDGVTDVIRNGENGVLVEPGDADGLAETIGSLMSGETDGSALRERAYHMHVQQYSDTAMAEATAGLYERILSSAGKR